MIIYYLL